MNCNIFPSGMSSKYRLAAVYVLILGPFIFLGRLPLCATLPFSFYCATDTEYNA